jgi:hypothetical protein
VPARPRGCTRAWFLKGACDFLIESFAGRLDGSAPSSQFRLMIESFGLGASRCNLENTSAKLPTPSNFEADAFAR